MKNLLNKKKSKIFIDNRGSLFFFENSNFKRVFFIYGKKNQVRGNHGHRLTTQLIININAKVKISIINKKQRKNLNLKTIGEYIEVPPMNWVSIKFLEAGCLSVVCNRKYSKRDYIYNLSKIKS
jgi:hypothetical protein